MTQENYSSCGGGKYFVFGCLSSLAILFCGFIVLLIAGVAGISALKTEEDFKIAKGDKINTTLLEGDELSVSSVAVIPVYGVITSDHSPGDSASASNVITLLNYAKNDDSIHSVILHVDSPGGEVTASDEIHHAVEELLKVKPVVVMMGGMAASGGYYISAPANFIIANPTTLTGSIGVIISGFNVEEGMNKIGIKNQVFTSGPFKDMLSPTRTMTDAEATYVQQMVNQSYDRFVNIVEEGRGLTRQQLSEHHAIDGRILSGADAKAAGLVDELGYFENAVNKAKELGECEDANVILLKRGSSFSDILSMIGMEASAPKTISVEMSSFGVHPLKPGLPYMLPLNYATGTPR